VNPDFPQNEREKLEAKLTAFLLGELPPDEVVALCKAMEQDAELAALYEQLKLTIELVRESTANPPIETSSQPAALRLSNDRREKLLAQFKTIAPKEFVRPRRRMDWLVPLAVVAAMVMMLASLLLPALSGAKSKAQKTTVLNNLRLLDGAKQQWALENNKPADAAPTLEELGPYMGRGGAVTLSSVAGETYLPGKVSEMPKVETSAGEAKKLFGRRAVANAEVRDGKVTVSPLEQSPSAISQATLGAVHSARMQSEVQNTENVSMGPEPALPLASTPAPVAEPSVPKTEIILPAGGQLAENSPSEVPAGASENKFNFGFAQSAAVKAPLTQSPSPDTNTQLADEFERAGSATVLGAAEPASFDAGVNSPGYAVTNGIAEFKPTDSEEIPVAQPVSRSFAIAGPIPSGSAGTATDTMALGFPPKEGQALAQAAGARAPVQQVDGGLSSLQGGGGGGGGGGIDQSAAHLVQDGKQLIQLGKLDDADGKTKEALSRDSNNQAALYYRSVIDQSRVRQEVDARNATSMDRTVSVQSWASGNSALAKLPASAASANNGKTDTYLAAKDQLNNEKRSRQFLAMKTEQESLDKELPRASTRAITAQSASPSQQNDAALPKPAVPPPTPQPEILTSENAFSTFSLNVSDVSFKLAAASLEKGQMPEPASIRSEEFINAFDYRDPDAPPGVPIAFASERASYPFAHNRELLRFSLKTAAAGRQAGRPLNIVLLLDNSGSMERADRVRIIQEALRVLAGQLQAQDTFSIVTFARTAQLRVDGIPGNQAAAAAQEIAKLTPEGGTNLGAALDLAYETALHHYLANGDNRVVLLTDGAANLGDVDPNALKQKVESHRQQGVALDCFGIGWEGFNDDLLEVLTRNGDGRYGFINTPGEAGTEFVAQIAGALHVAAADVKVQVEFNPKRVTAYRQIGYAKHQLTKEQFRDNTVDAAEIAAQEAGNALYTIETNPQGEGSIATVRVRYKVPGTAEYREQAWDVPYTGSAVSLDQASPAMRLAATASAFSEWLATSPFAEEVTTDQLLRYLNGVPQVYGADTRPTKLEWMIRQAKSISGK
jgi:Mg-chelatase subunit ChlD